MESTYSYSKTSRKGIICQKMAGVNGGVNFFLLARDSSRTGATSLQSRDRKEAVAPGSQTTAHSIRYRRRPG